MNKLPKVNEFNRVIFYLVAFTLPMFTLINNIFLGVFVVTSALLFIQNLERWNFKNWILSVAPIISFFILALIATINTGELNLDLGKLEKYWSFLLIPCVVQLDKNFFFNFKNKFFYGLLHGSLVSLVICYINTFYEMIKGAEPLSYFYRWRHLSHEFVAIIDSHPAYLGIFIVVSLYFTWLSKNKMNQKTKIVISVFFSFGMIQLSSRMAIFLFLFLTVIIILRGRIQFKKLIIGVISVLTLLISVSIISSDYLKTRLFNIDSITNDYRIQRLKVSYQLFLEKPLLGIGFNKIKEKRKKKYIENGYIIAANKNYNAHNQFMEYLSLNGVLGGLVFILFFGFFTVKCFLDRDWLFFFLFTSFFLANLSESMLVRIKGIEYFTIVTCLYLSKTKSKLFDIQ